MQLVNGGGGRQGPPADSIKDLEKVFFLYDRSILKHEEDDIADALLFYYPPAPVLSLDECCHFVGCLMGVITFSEQMMNKWPTSVKYEHYSVALVHTSRFTFGLKCSGCGSISLLEHYLRYIIDSFTLLYASIDYVSYLCDNDKAGLLHNLETIFTRLVSQSCATTLAPLQHLPTAEFHDDAAENHINLLASHISGTISKYITTLGICISYKGLIVSNELPKSLLYPIIQLGGSLFELPVSERVYPDAAHLPDSVFFRYLFPNERLTFRYTHQRRRLYESHTSATQQSIVYDSVLSTEYDFIPESGRCSLPTEEYHRPRYDSEMSALSGADILEDLSTSFESTRSTSVMASRSTGVIEEEKQVVMFDPAVAPEMGDITDGLAELAQGVTKFFGQMFSSTPKRSSNPKQGLRRTAAQNSSYGNFDLFKKSYAPSSRVSTVFESVETMSRITSSASFFTDEDRRSGSSGRGFTPRKQPEKQSEADIRIRATISAAAANLNQQTVTRGVVSQALKRGSEASAQVFSDDDLFSDHPESPGVYSSPRDDSAAPWTTAEPYSGSSFFPLTRESTDMLTSCVPESGDERIDDWSAFAAKEVDESNPSLVGTEITSGIGSLASTSETTVPSVTAPTEWVAFERPKLSPLSSDTMRLPAEFLHDSTSSSGDNDTIEQKVAFNSEVDTTRDSGHASSAGTHAEDTKPGCVLYTQSHGHIRLTTVLPANCFVPVDTVKRMYNELASGTPCIYGILRTRAFQQCMIMVLQLADLETYLTSLDSHQRKPNVEILKYLPAKLTLRRYGTAGKTEPKTGARIETKAAAIRDCFTSRCNIKELRISSLSEVVKVSRELDGEEHIVVVQRNNDTRSFLETIHRHTSTCLDREALTFL